MGKIMFVGAHPDDETFLAGATLAKYASSGHDVYVVTATRGEAGMWSDVTQGNLILGEVRQTEHQKAAEVLGIKSIKYLEFIDGTLSNKDMDNIVAKLEKIVKELKPDILMTMDLLGISGHIDHIVMALATTMIFTKIPKIKKLYYGVISKKTADEILSRTGGKVWGRAENEITTLINTEKWINKKIEAAMCHKTQMRDVERLLPGWKTHMNDYFVLSGSRVKTNIPEVDLFSGI